MSDATRGHLLDRLGIYPPLAWGYLGLLLFMIGDGVESGYLSSFLLAAAFRKAEVAAVFTAYGVTAAVAAWFSGALSDLWGPRRVMWGGLAIWAIFEVLFLFTLGTSAGYLTVLLTYAPARIWLSALCIRVPRVDHRCNAGAPARHCGGWFWFAFTGGLPTLGSLLASFTVPLIGAYSTLWTSLGLVLAGGLIALAGLREPTGFRRLAPEGENPLRTVLSSVTIAWRVPKTAVGCVVRIINTAPQFGFLVFLPVYFTQTVGFTLTEWLRLLSAIFLSNIVWNLLFGIIGDKFGWRRTVALCGGVGSEQSRLCFSTTCRTFLARTTDCASQPVSCTAQRWRDTYPFPH